MGEHICTVCFLPSDQHSEDCGTCNHWPPLCCPGCGCGSYEEAHGLPQPGAADKARVFTVVASVALLLTLIALPAAAQEPPAEPVDAEEHSLADYIYAAGWCPVRSGSDSDPAAVGCDAGIAIDFYSRPIGERYGVGIVAFVGAETVGAGIAWCRRGSRLCVGAGAAALRDDLGIDLDTVVPVVGATFSIGGLRE